MRQGAIPKFALTVTVLLALATGGCSAEDAKHDPAPEAVAQSAARTARQISGIATVLSGDTVELHGIDARPIKLWGIAAPLRHAQCGSTDVHLQASLALSAFIARQRLVCEPNEADQYNRITATCAVGGGDLGAYMAQQGWARDVPRESNGAYAEQEAAARAASRGVWALQCQTNVWGGSD